MLTTRRIVKTNESTSSTLGNFSQCVQKFTANWLVISIRFPFPSYARAAIGTGKLTILDSQPQSLSVNQAFHAINQAADHDRDKHRDESTLLIIEPFLREQPHLKTYAYERVSMGNETAWRIDWRRHVESFMSSFLVTSPLTRTVKQSARHAR